MGPWAAQVVGGSPRNSWSWDSVGFEVISYPNHSMIPWNHYHHIWQNESDSFHTASTIIRHKKKCCHVTKQPCKSDFLGDFSSLNNDQLNHSRRWEDVLFLLWSISNFSTLGAFSLESNKEVCAYSCCWKLQHHNAMLLSLFSWYPFPFLGHLFSYLWLFSVLCYVSSPDFCPGASGILAGLFEIVELSNCFLSLRNSWGDFCNACVQTSVVGAEPPSCRQAA